MFKLLYNSALETLLSLHSTRVNFIVITHVKMQGSEMLFSI